MAYFIFCITTALMGNIFLLSPVLKELAKSQPLNTIVDLRHITHVTFFLVSLMLAPMMFLSVIVPSFGERFRFSLSKSLESQ